MLRLCLLVLLGTSVLHAQGDNVIQRDLNVDSVLSFTLQLGSDLEQLQLLNDLIHDGDYTIETRVELGEWAVHNITPSDSTHALLIKSFSNYLGQRMRHLGLTERSLYFYKISQKMYEDFGVWHPEYLNIGHLYGNQGDREMQMAYYLKSLELLGNRDSGAYRWANSLAWSKLTVGINIIYEYPDSALKMIDHAIDLWKSVEVDERERGAIRYAYHQLAAYYLSRDSVDLPRVESLIDSTGTWEYREQLDTSGYYLSLMVRLSRRKNDQQKALYWAKRFYDFAKLPNEGAINNGTLRSANIFLSEIYQELGEDSLSLFHYQEYHRLDRRLRNTENQRVPQFHKYQKDRLAKEKEQELALNRERNKQILLGSAGFIFLLLAGGAYSRMNFISKSKKEIEGEKARSDELLLNILPAEVADELKAKGEATSRSFEQVTILFTDFVGFTETSSLLSPVELVDQVNIYFREFDRIMEHYGVEKIKTIGDAYMAAGGLMGSTGQSALNVVYAALDMQEFMKKMDSNHSGNSQKVFEMRAGIHTGPVVAGIVGVKKFQYDIWGDTVNTANRMEAKGESGRVNISQSTYELVKGNPELTFLERGLINVKGKGEMHMWYVSRKA